MLTPLNKGTIGLLNKKTTHQTIEPDASFFLNLLLLHVHATINLDDLTSDVA